jgi:hypothetical protein
MSTSPWTGGARDHVGSRTLTRSAVTTLFTVALAATSLGRAQADPAGAQSELTAVSGQGAGLVTIAPTSAAQGTFDARVTVNVHNSAPNTTFAVTRGGGDGTIDGVCTGTVFGQVATLTTSSGGAGAVEFERTNPNSPSGSQFEVMLRLLGGDGTILQSTCMIITVK